MNLKIMILLFGLQSVEALAAGNEFQDFPLLPRIALFGMLVIPLFAGFVSYKRLTALKSTKWIVFGFSVIAVLTTLAVGIWVFSSEALTQALGLQREYELIFAIILQLVLVAFFAKLRVPSGDR